MKREPVKDVKLVGSVEPLPSGRFRFRATVNGKRQTVGTYETEEEAYRVQAAWSLEVREGGIVAPSSLTLRAHGDQWLDHRELFGSGKRQIIKSIESERSNWTRHICAHPIAEMPLECIDANAVREFERWLRSRHSVRARRKGGVVTLRDTGEVLTQGTRAHVLRLLHRMLEPLVGSIFTRNPAKGISAAVDPIARSHDVSDDWLRQVEIDQLLGCGAIPIHLRTAYAAGIGLALRLNDLKNAEVADVDLDCKVPGPGIRVWISKSGLYHRVPIMPWLVPILRDHIARLPAGSRWLFPNAEGERYCKGYDFKWAKKKAKRGAYDSALTIAGVDRKIRFHDLRGTCATHLALGTWGRTWSHFEIQKMLAHSDAKVTERYLKRVVAPLAEAARNTPGGPRFGVHGRPRQEDVEDVEPAEIILERETGLEPATFSLGS